MLALAAVTGSASTAAHASSWESAYRARTHWATKPSKYNTAVFPDDAAGTFFSGTFSDHVVLQRGPNRASVNGVVIGATSETKVTVTVTPAGSAAKEVAAYTVSAVVVEISKQTKSGAYARWRALLQPMPSGGNYTVTAACTQCTAAANSSTLHDVTFGDVWFCSGQRCSPEPSEPTQPRMIAFAPPEPRCPCP